MDQVSKQIVQNWLKNISVEEHKLPFKKATFKQELQVVLKSNLKLILK